VSLVVCNITRDEAFAFVDAHHRHHSAPIQWLFGVAACRESGGEILGVAIVERPKARMLQDGWTCEVTRLASAGERNVCSLLYGACRRGAIALGWPHGITYTRADEPGSSLLASGWRRSAEVDGRSWDTPSRPRTDKTEIIDRVRWEFGESPKWARPRFEAPGNGLVQTSIFDIKEAG
jgi:hypothetical protein